MTVHQGPSGRPRLTFHAAGSAEAPAILVIPGGAYRVLAPHEGEPVAAWLNTLGVHAAVLQYGVGEGVWPGPLQEARQALRILRSAQSPLPADPARIGVLGSSAGGHLAGLLSTDTPDVPGVDPSDFAGRPDLAILAYPVTDLRDTLDGGIPNAHTASGINLLGPSSPDDVRAALSLPSRVEQSNPADLPDFFLWTTSDDERVPALHTITLVTALAGARAPFEAHVFHEGRHGLGLAADEAPDVAQWTTLAARWLAARGWIDPTQVQFPL